MATEGLVPRREVVVADEGRLCCWAAGAKAESVSLAFLDLRDDGVAVAATAVDADVASVGDDVLAVAAAEAFRLRDAAGGRTVEAGESVVDGSAGGEGSLSAVGLAASLAEERVTLDVMSNLASGEMRRTR